MNTTLKKIKNIRSENCITIIMNTHRTKPDYLKDELILKNLVKDVERRLLADTNMRDAEELLGRLNSLVEEIDHSHNLDSLVIFVNETVAEFTRLPVAVTDRVVIDNTFSTRDIVRAMHSKSNYYVLVLSQEKVRLIEALNNKVVKEFKSPFPIENEDYVPKSSDEFSIASRQSNLISEFFNVVDKEVNTIRKKKPLPVLICTVEENHGEYLKIADEKDSILNTFLNKNRVSEKDHAIVSEAWKLIEPFFSKKNDERKSELQKAVTENKFLSDANDIWRAISENRIQTLFIEEGLFQPAILENDEIIYVKDAQRNDTEVIDDIYDEMIGRNLTQGGDIVFLPKGALTKFNGFGAITRF